MSENNVDLGIKNNDFSDVVLNRQSVKDYQPNYKISRKELLQMVKESTVAPSAINSQPWHFLIIDNETGIKKLDSFVLGPDQKLIHSSSATIFVFADELWYKEHLDEIYSHYPEELSAAFHKVSKWWVPQLLGTDTDQMGAGMKEMTAVNAALVSMQFILVARAHGYDANIADAFKREGLASAFGLNEKRYKTILFFPIGKAAKLPAKTYRLPAEDVTTFSGPDEDFADRKLDNQPDAISGASQA